MYSKHLEKIIREEVAEMDDLHIQRIVSEMEVGEKSSEETLLIYFSAIDESSRRQMA